MSIVKYDAAPTQIWGTHASKANLAVCNYSSEREINRRGFARRDRGACVWHAENTNALRSTEHDSGRPESTQVHLSAGRAESFSDRPERTHR